MSNKLILTATCSCCGKIGKYELSEQEEKTYNKYQYLGRQMGMIQDLFPKVPAWIRSGAIDQYSGGFCICPDCQP